MIDYPVRSEEDLVDLCECGHRNFFHKDWECGNCIICTCPKYNFEQKMNRTNAQILCWKIVQQKEKDGFSI